MTLPWRCSVLLLAFFSLFSSSQAQTAIPLENPGFESPPLSIDSSFSSSVPGWSQIGPTGVTWAVPWASPSPAPEGDQYLFADGLGSTISQPIGNLESGRRYVFTIDVFALNDLPDNSIEVAFDVFQEVEIPGGTPINAFIRTAYSVYNVEWYRWLKDFDLAPQTWTTVEVVLEANDYPHLIGQPMQVRVTGNRYAADNARLVYFGEDEHPEPTFRTYYISSSTGSDDNDGLSPSSPWQTFRNINAMILNPGDSVLLMRGDEWRDELNLRGSGAPDAPITLASYGDPELDRPLIRRHDPEFDRCIVVQRPSHWVLREMDVRHAKLGIFLRYHNAYNNRDVTITDCRFEDMQDKTIDPAIHGFELAFSNGIWVGGHVWNAQMYDATVLDGLTITNCEAYHVGHLFSTAFYFPPPNRNRVTNVYIADSRAVDADNGAISLIGVSNLLMERVISIRGGVDNWAGSTLGMVQNAANVVIHNNEFGYIDRLKSGDGVGFDFEGDCLDCSFTSNTVHNASGSGLLILPTMGPNLNLNIEGNVFYNNAWNPWNNEMQVDVSSGTNQNTGIITNNGFYRRDDRVTTFSPLTSGFAISNNRFADFDPARQIAWWDMNDPADASAWSPLGGTTLVQGTDGITLHAQGEEPPAIESPPTWINSHLQPYLWVRSRQTTGSHMEVAFVTEPNQDWADVRSISHPVASDGVTRDYWIDMRQVSDWNTVITQVRLRWPEHSEVDVEHIRFTGSLDPAQERPHINVEPPRSMMIYSESDFDGSIIESAEGSQEGGTADAAGTSFHFGDDASNRRYRGFFSFDTSVIPDNAVITAAQVGFTRVSLVGNDPWTFGGSLVDTDYGTLDMAIPHFGSTPSLQPQDWQAPADVEDAGRYIVPYKDGLTVMDLLIPEARQLLAASDRAQFRLRMEERGTNFNNAPDFIRIATGSASESQRPFLHIEYYLDEAPDPTPPPSPPDYWERPTTIPRPPLDLMVAARSHDEIVWQWTDDSEQEEEFRLYFAEGTQPAPSPTSVVPANTTGAIFDNLTSNTVYTLAVTAANTAGESGPTNPSTAVTHAQTPQAPQLIETTPGTVRFEVPMGSNPVGTEVAVRVETPNATGWLQPDGQLSEIESWFEDASSLHVVDLEPSAEIEIRAKARNQADEETELSEPLSTTVSDPAPSVWMF